MHEYYREKGVPANVELVTTGIADLPFEDGSLDAAFSTMTYHEIASDDAVTEIRRVLEPMGHLAIAEWAATSSGSMARRSTNGTPPTWPRTPSAITGSRSNTKLPVQRRFCWSP